MCPRGVLTPFSLEAWRLFNVLKGYGSFRNPHEFYEQPALWIEAVDVMKSELAIVQKIKAK